MRLLSVSLVGCAALMSCSSQPVQISSDRCWSVAVGDKVEGTAVLFAYAGNECIECGAFVSGRNCPSVEFAAANDVVDQAYDRIVHSASVDDFGFVRQVVFLSGEVISNGATGKPMIRASSLRLVTADGI